MLKAVIVVALNRSGTVEEPWNPVVWRVVRPLMKIAERPACGRAQAKRQRGRNSNAVTLGNVAPGNSGILPHEIKAEGHARSQRWQGFVDVRGYTLGFVSAEVCIAGHKIIHTGRFGFLIDDPARGASSESDRRRPLQNGDLLCIKGIAVVAAKVAHAVNEKIIARGEAADGKAVALGPALACRQADACDVAERVP